MSHYYDLVSGLPLLSLEGESAVPDFAATIDHLQDLVSPGDTAALRMLRLPYDNGNVVAELLGLPREFDPRGNWSVEALRREIEHPDAIPPYLEAFIRSRGEGGESRLDALFFGWVTEQEPKWVSDWFAFELHLKSLMAVLMRRKYASVGGALEIPPIDELAERIESSTAADCGVSQSLSWVPRVAAAIEEGPLQMEKIADQIRWEKAGELSGLDHFGAGEIFTFTVRLALAGRWSKLDSASGRARLERLVDALKVEVS